MVDYEKNLDIHTVTYEGWTCSLGVFPVSIKNEDFLVFAKHPDTLKKANDIRLKASASGAIGSNSLQMMSSSAPDGCLFFSVERFDYTKGIKEKLYAYRNYFQLFPDRIGKDVLYQASVLSRLG